MLKDIDSDYAKKVNKNDEVRIIRALEVFMITGKQISKILSEESNNKLSNDYEISQFAITHDRELLHKRIESRLDKIIEEGMLEEAEYLLKKSSHNVACLIEFFSCILGVVFFGLIGVTNGLANVLGSSTWAEIFIHSVFSEFAKPFTFKEKSLPSAKSFSFKLVA